MKGGGGGCPLVRLVGDARPNLTKFLSLSLKVVPGPSEAFLVAFWTDEKPYKCIASKQTSMGLKGLINHLPCYLHSNMGWYYVYYIKTGVL